MAGYKPAPRTLQLGAKLNDSTDNTVGTERSLNKWLPYVLPAIVILPIWAVIGIPASVHYRYGEYRMHGWPFIMMETCRFDNKIGVLRPGISSIAQQSAEDYFRRKSMPEREEMFDLRLGKRTRNQFSYWSNSRNWPFAPASDGFASRWHWIGLLANLLILGVIIFCIGKFLSRRIRLRGRLLSLSLWELILLVTLCAIPFAIVCREYDRASKEEKLIDVGLETFDWSGGTTTSGMETTRNSSISELLSQLVDHRNQIPNSDLELFHPVSNMYVKLDADFLIPKETKDQQRLVKLFKEAQFPIKLDIRRINKNTEWLLNKIHGAETVKTLSLKFDYRVKRGRRISVVDDVEIDLDMSFPKLESLEIYLNERTSQEKQMQPLLNLSNSYVFRIEDVTKSGAEFLIENRQRLPEKVYADLGDQDIISDEFRAAFYKEFEPWKSKD